MKGLAKICAVSAGFRSGFKGWRVASLILVGIIAILAIPTNSAFAQTPVQAGYRDFNFGSGSLPFPSGVKTESKLWWNDGSWWGTLWSPTANAWHIYQFDQTGQDWVDTGTLVEPQKRLVDCLWDDASQKLYVVSNTFTETGATSATSGQWGKLYRFTYGSGTKQYTLDAGFPVTVTLGIENTLTIAKDSFGILWVSYIEGSQVMVNHSLSSDSTWGTPFALPGASTAVNTFNDDITGTVAFGGNKIGVMWSNGTAGQFYFAQHNDGDADSVWQPVETAYPSGNSSCTGICADSHLNLKADSTGRIFAMGLTGLSGTTNMASTIVMMTRSTSGTWQSYTAWPGAAQAVRPLVMLDETNGKLIAFASNPPAGGTIYTKSTDMNNPQFNTSVGSVFIQSTTDTTINNATSTKQPVNSTTGVAVLASDQNTLYYLHNFVSIGGSGPTITSFSPTSGSVGTSVTINGSAFTGATAVKFNGTNATSFTENSDTKITATVPAGATTGPISVTNPTGTGTSTTNFTILGPPVISSFTPTSGAVGTAVTISGTGFTGATNVAFNGTSATFTVKSDVQITTAVPNGATTGDISVTTPNGTATSASSFTIIPGPGITSFTPTSGPVGTNVTVNGSGFTGATSITFNGTASTTFSVVSDVQMTATVPTGATTGPIAVTTSGGTGTSSANFTVMLPPVVKSFTPTSGTAGTSVEINGTGFTGVTTVLFNGLAAKSFAAISDAQVTAVVAVGATTGPISVTTPAGTGTSTSNFTVTAPPTISSFSPTGGPVGTTVTINGSAFTGATSVAFNGTSASLFTVVSDIQVTATVPAGATTGPISVTSPAGTGTSASSFMVAGAPIVSSFSPASGIAGTSVKIKGSGFTGATNVSFAGTPATFKVGSATSITATVPSGATTGPISVTTPTGTAISSTNFTVSLSPQISSFSPTSGPVGTSVTIDGLAFTGTKSVAFNGKNSSFAVVSDTQITANVPTGATTGPIKVTNAVGSATSASSFTVTAAPVVSSFTPASGGVGTSVNIKGSGFTGATNVAFNGTPASFTVVSATSITATVPSGATTGPVSVTTPISTASSTGNFTVLVPPQISSFSPTSGPVGTVVTITGVGFTGAKSVSFNGKATKPTGISDTQLSAKVPAGATTGPISVTTAAGTGTSSTSFTVM